MKASEHRILTTHAGSLPRTDALFALLVRGAAGQAVDPAELRERALGDVTAVVRHQLEAGLDVVNDGELARTGFSLEHPKRMTGFGGVSPDAEMADTKAFPGYGERFARWTQETNRELERLGIGGLTGGESMRPFAPPMCVGAVAYDPEQSALTEQLEIFETAVATAPREPAETFVTAPTPGIISTSMRRSADNPAYATDRDYLLALASALHVEYRSITDRGHVLQLDAPDLAMERHFMFAGRPQREFLDRLELHVEALNAALDGIPRDRVRLHVCWGNYDGPHTADVELAAILEQLYESSVGALMLPFANPRHQHDPNELRDRRLPEGMRVIAGVIDTTTNYVEHPEVVADRIVSVAEIVGDPTRVLAGTDCGLSTFAGFTMVAEDVAWEKLRSLAAGARIASERLF